MPEPLYKKPYFDSTVLIAWIKNEQMDANGVSVTSSGKPVAVERGKIGEHLLTLSEQRVFPVVISALTLAETHKKKGKEKLREEENKNILRYFQHDFIVIVPVDRAIGEEANALCRKYEDEGLSPADAIHLACAKSAGCDILLSWNGVLNKITDPAIRTEEPVA